MTVPVQTLENLRYDYSQAADEFAEVSQAAVAWAQSCQQCGNENADHDLTEQEGQKDKAYQLNDRVQCRLLKQVVEEEVGGSLAVGSHLFI